MQGYYMVFLLIINHHCFAFGSQPSSSCLLLSWPFSHTALTDFYSDLEFNSLQPPTFSNRNAMAMPYPTVHLRGLFISLQILQARKHSGVLFVSLKWTLKCVFREKSFTPACFFFSEGRVRDCVMMTTLAYSASAIS